MNGLVLSGVSGLVLSGVSLSCYQACESHLTSIATRVFPPLNALSNVKNYLTNNNLQLLWQWITATDRRKDISWNRSPSRRAMP